MDVRCVDHCQADGSGAVGGIGAARVSRRRDPSTVGAWGSAVGACETTIHTTCRALGLSARDSRDFARVLRALRQKAGSLRDLDALLIVAEPRTWKQLLERAGFDGSPADSLISLDEFLRRQRFVPLDHRALKTLRVWIAKAHA